MGAIICCAVVVAVSLVAVSLIGVVVFYLVTHTNKFLVSL